MAKYTTLKCDKCGKEWLSTDKSQQIATISLTVEFNNDTGRQSAINPYTGYAKSAMWCRGCVMKQGLCPPTTTADKEIFPPPREFEDIVIELLEDLGFARQ